MEVSPQGSLPFEPPSLPHRGGKAAAGRTVSPPSRGAPTPGYPAPAWDGGCRHFPACVATLSSGPWVTATFPAPCIPERVPPQHPSGSPDPLWSLPPAVPHPERYPLLPRSFQGCKRVKAQT